MLAARRAGVTTVILPKQNGRDLPEIPEELRRDLKFVLAQRVDDVLEAAMSPAPLILPKPVKKSGPPKRRPAKRPPVMKKVLRKRKAA